MGKLKSIEVGMLSNTRLGSGAPIPYDNYSTLEKATSKSVTCFSKKRVRLGKQVKIQISLSFSDFKIYITYHTSV